MSVFPIAIDFLCYSTAMHESSKRLHECLVDMYEPEWDGKDEMDSVVEVTAFSTFVIIVTVNDCLGKTLLSNSICLHYTALHWLLYCCFIV